MFGSTMRFLCTIVTMPSISCCSLTCRWHSCTWVVLLSLPFACMQESHRSCFHRKLAWLPPSVFYLVMVSVLLLLRAISLNAWTGTLPQPGERYVVCYMCTKVCMLHVVLHPRCFVQGCAIAACGVACVLFYWSCTATV